jgi:uncharacterized protein with HEPN domain
MAASGSPRARLLPILDEIEGVAAAVKGLTFEQYKASYVHRRKVERAAQIVSEATRALPRDMLARHGGVPGTSIIGIGNILRHEYQRLDDAQLWEIATVHLPALEPAIRQMIVELEG